MPLLSSSSTVFSSSIRDSNHTAKHGLLANSSSIWCPQSNSTIEWLEVDLGAPYFICGVAAVNDVTVGNRSSVTWYQVHTSLGQFTDDPRKDNTSKVIREYMKLVLPYLYIRLQFYIFFQSKHFSLYKKNTKLVRHLFSLFSFINNQNCFAKISLKSDCKTH